MASVVSFFFSNTNFHNTNKMIKANELRIGNFITYADKIGIVDGFINREICHSSGNRDYNEEPSYEPFKGIQITEEWILRAGFEKLTSIEKGFKSNSYTYGRGYSFIVHLNNGLLSTNFWQGNEKKFVHQLQNLFFSLVGEELIFSSTEP